MFQIVCEKHEPGICELTTSNGYKETFYQCRKCGISMNLTIEEKMKLFFANADAAEILVKQLEKLGYKFTLMKKEKPISKIRLAIRKAEFKKLTA